jgi:transcriptional regulator with XRE-family HTH domain
LTANGSSSPTAVRRELGQRLRGLRLDKDLTVAEVAVQIGVSQSRLTKIELGQAVAKRDDVLKLLDVYEEDDTQQQALLLAMVRASASKEWWEGRRALPPKLGNYLGLESVADILQAYDTHLVHGLLQTPDYARALLRAERPELLAHEIDRLVELRMRRQQILTRADPPAPTLWSIMDEAVLRRPVGGRETMHAQLQQLIERSELPNVTLLVMPDDLGAHAGMDGPFAIFQFETGARPVVYVEGQAGNLYLEKDDDLRRCQQTMNHILAAAPGPEHSLALIRQVAKEMKHDAPPLPALPDTGRA